MKVLLIKRTLSKGIFWACDNLMLQLVHNQLLAAIADHTRVFKDLRVR
jgi:hypothetical protein